MTIRPKIKVIGHKTDKFKISYFHDGNSYKEYRFLFEKVSIKISTYYFPFRSKVRLEVSEKKVDLKTKEKKLLLKAFKGKRKKWRKENSDIVDFDLNKEQQQNDLLNSITFK